jgi:hypothetical protein
VPRLRDRRRRIIGCGQLRPKHLQLFLACFAQTEETALDQLGVDQRDTGEIVGGRRTAMDAFKEEMQAELLSGRTGGKASCFMRRADVCLMQV